MRMGWTIKQVAAMTGLSADTLRYYDKEGVVSPKRSENGYRQYEDQDISFLKNVIVMKYAHFSLDEMKSMEELYSRKADANCSEICKEMLTSKITELRHAIQNYQKIVTLMEELLSMVDGVDFDRVHMKQINGFISQLFDDIRNDRLCPHTWPSQTNRNEVL